MYLKKYDLEKIKPIADTLLSLDRKTETEVFRTYNIDTGSRKALVIVGNIAALTVYDDGCISVYEVDTGKEQPISNLPAIMEEILNTQWRNPKIELPKEVCEVYLKTDIGIILGVYSFDYQRFGSMFMDSRLNDRIIGWMPKENVEL